MCIRDRVYPAGYLHLPKIDAEFLQQLCAEQLITRRDRSGYAVREWQKLRERNEAVSYTHLDVYKRQMRATPSSPRSSAAACW